MTSVLQQHKRAAHHAAGKMPGSRPIVLAFYLACAGIVSLAPGLSAPVHAQQLSDVQAYAIPAGTLATALTRFSEESGFFLAGTVALAEGKNSKGLQGNFTVRDGLATLLAGTGLVARVEDKTITLQKVDGAGASAAELAVIRVNARRGGNGTTEDAGSYSSRVTSIASKTDQSFREIPQSVSVITRAQIDDQRIIDVVDAIKMTPGLIVTNEMGSMSSRGFEVSTMQIDGGAPLAMGAYTYVPQQDMAFYDRVEVMRGASGLLGGMGDPGGIINLARKKPLAEKQFLVSQSVGSWSNYRTEVDITGPMGFDGRLRGRAVAAYQNSNSYLDYHSTEKPMFYGVIEADLTPRTVLTFGGSYVQYNKKGDGGGSPRYTDGRSLDLPRGASLSAPWAYNDYTNKEVFAQLEHEFENRWKAKLNVTHTDAQLDRAWSTFGGGVDPVTLLGPVWRGGQIWAENKQDVVDINLSGPFKLFGRTHEILVGADWQRVRSSWMAGAFPGSGTIRGNVFNPPQWIPPNMNAVPDTLYSPWGQEQKGAYGVLRLHPTDRLHVIVGARASKYDFTQRVSDIDQGVLIPYSDTSFKEPTKITPYGGVIYDLTDKWSTYLSYATIYQPQALKFKGPKPGTPLKPIEGKSIEAGLKGELFDGKANATLSLFHVERTGTAVEDPAYPIDADNIWGGMCCYLPQGKVTSQGYDAEFAGQITPAWQAAIGYTFNVTKDKETDKAYSAITPKHLLKAATVYTLPGALSKWQVGGNAQIQSMQYLMSGDARIEEGGHAVWGAMVKYTIDPTWTATLNVNNLFDKTYYRTVSGSFTNNWYGTPRNWALTLRGKF